MTVNIKYTKEDLKTMQSWPISRKIQVTQTRIMEWYIRWEGGVYISFSGGKDSTVLLDLARRVYPNIPAVFVDTGLEYPEIREFVKSKENVEWLHPLIYNKQNKKWKKTNFKEVINIYGYPVISKEVSHSIENFRNKPNGHRSRYFDRNSLEVQKYGLRYCLEKWIPLKESDIPISSSCCDIMKKNPFKQFEKTNKIKPIVATMACESKLRKNAWLSNGCNAFDSKRPISQPMSFWTEQDVLTYLKEFQIHYSSIYGSIIPEMTNYKRKENKPTGKLLLTGEQRTGCMFCMYGCHLEKEPNRFQRMKITHPKQYDYCIKNIEDGGLGLGGVLDYIGVKY